MLFKTLSLAALASVAAAQMNLTTAISSNPNLANLTQYLGFYPQLVAALSNMTNVTILAPSNQAFTKLLSGPGASQFSANNTDLINALFSYHVLDGTYYTSDITNNATFIPTKLTAPNYSNLTGGQVVEAVLFQNSTTFFSGLLSNSSVVQANINYTGGVLHVVDTFLTIPQNISTTLVATNLTAAAGALEQAGTAGGKLPANLTAFIPNNAAFQAIGSALSNISTQSLAGILAYHLVPDVVAYSTDLGSGMNLTSSTNQTLYVTVKNGSYFVNNAKIIIPNILVMEGVVHVIDEVLNPQNITTNGTSEGPAFAGASSAGLVPFTSNIPAATATAANPSGGATGSAGAGSSSKGGAMPMKTGAVAAAALFGGAAAVLNL